jgi:hypothetical protein
MKSTDVQKLVDMGPRERAAQMLDMGSELHKRLKEPYTELALPRQLRRESVVQTAAAPILGRLHGVSAAEPVRTRGITETGRTLMTKAGAVTDLVLTPHARKSFARIAMDRTRDRSVDDLAIRQLGLGMMDSDPLARCCAAYAYWLATGADAAIPVLANAIDSEDEEERLVGAHCLAKVRPSGVKKLHGNAEDDKPQTTVDPIRDSMTVIIHGTFASNSDWYRPGGDFHTYIKKEVYPDVYSGEDFFSWSGRYSLTDPGLKRIWRQGADKLVAWCKSHPAGTLRLIGHSHGNNVVNMASPQLPSCVLIQLSPPVRDWNLPDISKVSSGSLFNIHSRIDLVVKIDGGAQDYKGTSVAPHESRRSIAPFGHSASHDQKKWAKKKVPQLVKTLCS